MLMRETESVVMNYSDIKKKIDNDYNSNQTVWQKFWIEAVRDNNLEAGIVYNTQNYALPFNNNSTPYYFNRVRPLLNMVSGWQRRNRKSSIVVPLENGDQETADQWTKILMSIYKREGVYETISDAFHQGALVTGLNLLQVYLDFQEDDLNGEVKVRNLAFNEVYMDPYWRKHDLSDCGFIMVRSYLTHLAAASLMPSRWDDIMALPGNPAGMGRDGRFQYEPEATGQAGKNLLAYDEYYYRDFRTQKRLVDKLTGEWMDVTYQDADEVADFVEVNPDVYLSTRDIPTVKLAIQIQGHVYYNGSQPSQIDTFPFVPVIGFYNPSLAAFSSRIQGLCRSLRDPQALLNRRIILSADLLESQINSGWKFKEGAPLDIAHLFQTGQGRVIPVKKGFELGDIEQIQPPQVPPSFFQMQETFSKELNLVSGVSEENMGQIVDDQASGFKAALRQAAGMASLEPLFDRLNFSQNLLGNVIMEVVRKNYLPYKIKQMLGGQEPAPLFFNKAFGRYHCMIEQGFNTESQKQMEFAQRLELRNAGIMISDEDMIESATLQGKTKIIENMQKQKEQVAQAQQQQMEAQMQLQQAQAESYKAKSYADIGLYNERTSRVEENRALAIQKISEANQNQEQALLNKIKILKEIEDIDFGHLERLMNLATMLKSQEVAQTKDLAEQAVQ